MRLVGLNLAAWAWIVRRYHEDTVHPKVRVYLAVFAAGWTALFVTILYTLRMLEPVGFLWPFALLVFAGGWVYGIRTIIKMLVDYYNGGIRERFVETMIDLDWKTRARVWDCYKATGLTRVNIDDSRLLANGNQYTVVYKVREVETALLGAIEETRES